MRQLFDIVRAIFISFEFLYVLVLIFMLVNYPAILCTIGDFMRMAPDTLKYLPTFHVPFISASAFLTFKILSPLQSTNKTLYDWPDYFKMKNRSIISVVMCAIAAIGAIITWIVGTSLENKHLAFSILLTYVIPLIVIFNQFVASLLVREYLEKYES